MFKLFKYDFSSESRKTLFRRIKDAFETDTSITNSYCGKAKDVFLKGLRKQLKMHNQIIK